MADTIRRPEGGHVPGPGAGPASGLRQHFVAALQTPAAPPRPPMPPTAPTGGPTAVPVTPVVTGGVAAGVVPVDFEQISELRAQVANLIAVEGAGVVMTAIEDRHQFGMERVVRVVAQWATDYTAHVRPLTREEEVAVRQAVFDSVFRAGRLQPLLDDPGVENIIINGCDEVVVDYQDRPQHRHAPVAGTDAELVDLVNQLARTQGQSERVLTPSTPNLNMRLDDGSRLAASYLVTPRPHVVIRKHRIKDGRLRDLVAWGTIDPVLEQFLAGLVRARKNVIVVGSQAVGKTSLLRAMAREIPETERIGTLESEFELWLHEIRDGVVAYEARESNGERGPDGRLSGEITLSDLIPQALRMSLRRILVGEVRSKEVVPMLHAMNEGEGGSMCTLHARTARSAMDRIATLCLEAGIGMTETLAYRLVAEAIDFIVYIRLVDETAIGGVKHRFVSEIVEITGIGETGRPSVQRVFGPREANGHREVRAVPDTMPLCIEDLVRAGFERSWWQYSFGAWDTPLTTVVPL